jgi:hypothetical protein
VATLKRRHPPALTYDRATDAIDAVAAACEDEAAPVSGAALRALLPFLRGANVGAAQAALEALDYMVAGARGAARSSRAARPREIEAGTRQQTAYGPPWPVRPDPPSPPRA